MSALAAPAFSSAQSEVSSGVSAASTQVLKQWLAARQHSTTPLSRATVGQRFTDLAETWRQERGPDSMVANLVLVPAYQQIIALGQAVVPSILLELARKPDHWFWALTAITGVNPVPEEARGNIRAMANAWITWGEQKGLLD
jgi:hypothetical protein